MAEKIFDTLETILDEKIRAKVGENLQEAFKKCKINLTNDGELSIKGEDGITYKKAVLQSRFNVEVEYEKRKLIKKILQKLGYPIEE